MQKIAILYDASQAVISTFDLDEVLEQILAILRDYFHLRQVAVLLMDPEQRVLRVRCHSGWTQEGSEMGIPIGKGLIGNAAKLKRPIYAPDVTRDPRYIPGMPNTCSELAVPLIVRDEVVGVLDCQSETPRLFDTETIDLLTLFSTQASIALQNARLYSQEQRKAAQLEAINRIARQTTSLLKLGELLEHICSNILESFPVVDHVSVLLREEEQLVLRRQSGRLTSCFGDGKIELRLDQGLSGRALQSGRAVLENDVTAAVDYVAGYAETCSEMALPLISHGESLGVLVLESARRNAFQASEVQPLESVADICANAIQNARYLERMSQLAYLDGLTGIFNRRHFELRMRDELERTSRYEGTGMSVIMVDIDHFKLLNDEFGHLLGDEVLRQVSSLFRQHLRKPDVLCRYGGEEFAIIAPETSVEGALIVAEKLRKVVEAWPFPGVPRPVTISAGIGNSPAHGGTRDEVVKAADAALYQAKQSGRNRIVVAAARAVTA